MFPCFLSPVTVFLSLLPQAMFSLCMVESGADEVNLHGVTSLGLKQALEFAYAKRGGQEQFHPSRPVFLLLPAPWLCES